SVHPDDLGLTAYELERVAKGGERDWVLRLRSADGLWHPVRVHARAQFDHDGRLNHLRCALHDATYTDPAGQLPPSGPSNRCLDRGEFPVGLEAVSAGIEEPSEKGRTEVHNETEVVEASQKSEPEREGDNRNDDGLTVGDEGGAETDFRQ